MDQVYSVIEKLSVHSLLHKPEKHMGNADYDCSFHFDAISEDQILLAKRPCRIDAHWIDAVWILSLASDQIVAAAKQIQGDSHKVVVKKSAVSGEETHK